MSTIVSLLPRLGRSLQEAIFPSRCLACGAFFVNPAAGDGSGEPSEPAEAGDGFAKWTAAVACPECGEKFMPVASPLCTVCGVPFKGREGQDHHCQQCLQNSRHYDSARACGVYDETLQALIHWFKYKDCPQLAGPLGRLLGWGFKRHYAGHPFDMLMPVPLHRRRFRQRGFNQAYLLAREGLLQGADGQQRPAAPILERSLLVRCRPTRPQTGLGRTQRAKNMRKAFALTDPRAIEGQTILLVDDVYTTGATVNECAAVLKQAGAKRVDVLTLARAL